MKLQFPTALEYNVPKQSTPPYLTMSNTYPQTHINWKENDKATKSIDFATKLYDFFQCFHDISIIKITGFANLYQPSDHPPPSVKDYTFKNRWNVWDDP